MLQVHLAALRDQVEERLPVECVKLFEVHEPGSAGRVLRRANYNAAQTSIAFSCSAREPVAEVSPSRVRAAL
jgi:hypothetical protein